MFFKPIFKKRRIYLDFASSSPVDLRLIKSIPKIPKNITASNPGSLHYEGVTLKKFLSEARARVAKVLEVQTDEVIFTSGATESNNLALVGVVKKFLSKGIKHDEIVVFSSDLEHSAINETIESIKKWGVRSVILESECGIINPKDIVVLENAKAVIISIMYVNNEIGTVEPIIEIAKRVRKLRKENLNTEFVLHTDATQAPEHFKLRVPSLGVDMMTLGSTKLYCHKGVGILYKKRNIKLDPIIYGGGQEFGLRPGTEPVELIHEFSYSLEYANKIREKETERVIELQKYFESQIKKNFPQLKITAENSPRTPHISHIAVPNFDSELLVIELDARGIAVSAKSACKNEEDQESPIVENIYGKNFGAIRFSFGRTTTKKELDKTIEALGNIFEKYTRK